MAGARGCDAGPLALFRAGQIVRVPGPVVEGAQQYGGHDIALTVNVDRARIEIFLRLASRSGKVLLTGDVTMKTSLHIPPGPAPVHEAAGAERQLCAEHARFASAKIQGRITELSLRGQGRPGDVRPPIQRAFCRTCKAASSWRPG